MQTKQFLTLAVLGAALLPMAGVCAQDNTGASGRMGAADAMSGGDVGEFRDQLHKLHDYFSEMRENNNLALAAQDALLASNYQQMNRHLAHQSLGVLDKITLNWKRMDTPDTNVQQMGSKDMARYAAESDDTAFVRNTVWQLQSELLAAKLNGREDTAVTHHMMEMLDAAIARADNPNFRVASASSTHQVQLSEWSWERSGGTAAGSSSSSSEQVASNNTSREWREVTIEHENLPDRSRVAMAPEATTSEEVSSAPEAPERMGAANPLPQTGGPGDLLYLLGGSGFLGMGGLLIRRRRS